MPSDEQLNPGLQTLIEFGVVPRRSVSSAAREAIVDCIGCHLTQAQNGEVVFSGTDIARCQSQSGAAISEMLRRLNRSGVIEKVPEQPSSAMNTRQPYRISQTAVGIAFKATVQPPAECP